MRVCVVKIGNFIAPGQKRINPVLLAATVLALAGCSHSDESAQFSMAPPPPVFDPNTPAGPPEPQHLMAFTGQPIPFPSNIQLTDPGMPGQDSMEQMGFTSTQTEEKGCRIKDRFDRGALLAYQWGQNRVALNVKGINLDSDGIEGVKVQYTLKLQDHKSHKERCKYDSHWQGIVGSSYNELFLRKEDTVWGQVHDIKTQITDGFDKLLGD
jgi:hypothetical protein